MTPMWLRLERCGRAAARAYQSGGRNAGNRSRRRNHRGRQNSFRRYRSRRRDRPHPCDGRGDRSCNCGNYGCLEQYTSATGIVRLAKRRLAEDDKPSALRETGNISAKTVFDAVKEGDELAVEVAERFGEILGKTLADIAGVVNPEIFVIGGGVSKGRSDSAGFYSEELYAVCLRGKPRCAVCSGNAGK